MIQKTASAKVLLAITALAGWFALIAQLYIYLQSGEAGVTELLIRYFSFFTICTNIIVAVCATALLVRPASHFFSSVKTITAIAVYILVVGLIYNTILRFTWNPVGLQRIVDELLHSVIPVLFLIIWVAFTNKGSLQWKNSFNWLIYPLYYTAFIFVRGYFSGFYPYPFVDVTKLGSERVIINSLGIALLFWALSLLFIGIGKLFNKKRM